MTVITPPVTSRAPIRILSAAALLYPFIAILAPKAMVVLLVVSALLMIVAPVNRRAALFGRWTAAGAILALDLAGREGLQFPLLVLAETQTAGRGRKTNRWWTDAGALCFSLVLDSTSRALPPSRWPQASLTAGLAVCEALEELLTDVETDVDVQLKWPNDVYVNRKKISGVLLESPHLKHGKLVIGVGINVNNSLDTAPAEISDTATAMCDVADQQFPLATVLVCVLDKLFERLNQIGYHDQQLGELWRKRCLLTGRKVHVDTAHREFAGLCQGIDEAGALLVQTDTNIERCLAGTITLVEG